MITNMVSALRTPFVDNLRRRSFHQTGKFSIMAGSSAWRQFSTFGLVDSELCHGNMAASGASFSIGLPMYQSDRLEVQKLLGSLIPAYNWDSKNSNSISIDYELRIRALRRDKICELKRSYDCKQFQAIRQVILFTTLNCVKSSKIVNLKRSFEKEMEEDSFYESGDEEEEPIPNFPPRLQSPNPQAQVNSMDLQFQLESSPTLDSSAFDLSANVERISLNNPSGDGNSEIPVPSSSDSGVVGSNSLLSVSSSDITLDVNMEDLVDADLFGMVDHCMDDEQVVPEEHFSASPPEEEMEEKPPPEPSESPNGG